MIIDLSEFDKLERMLRDAGIKYEREDEEDGTPDYKWEFHRLRHPEPYGEKWLWDVVCNSASYGHEKGLLEIWGKDIAEPEGWLTAEECFDKIKKIVATEVNKRLDDYERSRKEKTDPE